MKNKPLIFKSGSERKMHKEQAQRGLFKWG